MTNANLLPAGPAVSPGDFSSTLPVEPAVKETSPAEDFFGLVSRARQDLSQQPNQPPCASPIPAQTSSPNQITAHQEAPSSENKSESDSTGKTSQSKQDSSIKDNGTDPSLAATLLAMMALFGAAELPKPLQLSSGGKKSAGGSEQTSLAAAVLTTTGQTAEKTAVSPKSSNSAASANTKDQNDASPTDSNSEHAAQDAKSSAPGNSAPVPNPPASNNKPSAEKVQTVAEKEVVNQILGAKTPVSGAGTGVALNSQRMNLGDEKNEIAGRAVQKVPRAERNPADSAETAPKLATASADVVTVATKKEAAVPALTLDSSVTPVALNATQGRGMENAPSIDRSAAQAERVAQMVTREVVMVRQSGATGLAVSLKLDPHTELFLQLTNQNGQIQALLRCERGNVSGLDSHWGDLQESLARQNVQLLPFENKTPANPACSSSPAASSASTTSYHQSSQHGGRSAPELNEDPILSAPVARGNSVSMKTKTKTISGQGWESWA